MVESFTWRHNIARLSPAFVEFRNRNSKCKWIFFSNPFFSFACSSKLSLASCRKKSKRFRFSDLCNERLRSCKGVDFRLLLVGGILIRSFGGNCYFHLQGSKVKLEIVPSKTLVHRYQGTRHHVLENRNFLVSAAGIYILTTSDSFGSTAFNSLCRLFCYYCVFPTL